MALCHVTEKWQNLSYASFCPDKFSKFSTVCTQNEETFWEWMPFFYWCFFWHRSHWIFPAIIQLHVHSHGMSNTTFLGAKAALTSPTRLFGTQTNHVHSSDPTKSNQYGHLCHCRALVPQHRIWNSPDGLRRISPKLRLSGHLSAYFLYPLPSFCVRTHNLLGSWEVDPRSAQAHWFADISRSQEWDLNAVKIEFACCEKDPQMYVLIQNEAESEMDVNICTVVSLVAVISRTAFVGGREITRNDTLRRRFVRLIYYYCPQRTKYAIWLIYSKIYGVY